MDAPVKPEHDRNIVPEYDGEKSRSMTERKAGACLSEVLSNENLPIRHIPA